MSVFARTIKVGDKTYNLSISGKDVYFSSSSKTGGTTLKGIKVYNNEFRKTSDNKFATDFDIAAAINRSL